MIYVRKIDEQGFFIEDSFVEELNEFAIETPCPQGFYKPKWSGTEWIEGATQEYIDSLNVPIVDEQEELNTAISSATTLEELKSALLGRNNIARVKAERKVT